MLFENVISILRPIVIAWINKEKVTKGGVRSNKIDSPPTKTLVQIKPGRRMPKIRLNKTKISVCETEWMGEKAVVGADGGLI